MFQFHWAQLKSAHFWLVVLSSVVGLLSQTAAITGLAHQALMALSALLMGAGYTAAVNWQAPSTDLKGTPPMLVKSLLPIFLILSLGMGSLSGCATFKGIGTKILNCAVPSVENGIPAALQDVVVALSGGTPDWIALAELEGKYGLDVVACAVKAVLGTVLDAPHSMAQKNLESRIKNNASSYLKAKGLQ